MTTAGFYSAVQDREDATLLWVRTRDRESIQVLKDGIETTTGHEVEIREREGTDYPYRVLVGREDFAQWVAVEIREYINYTNFKSAAKETRGSVYADALSGVWLDMRKITDPEMEDHGIWGHNVNPHYDTSWRDEEYQ